MESHLKVTGGAVYAADNAATAYGYLLTSTIAFGTVTTMDTAAAQAAPGVFAVYTPFNPLKLYGYGDGSTDETAPVLQDAAVRYNGQVIGMVVADTFEHARDAASLVSTTYDAKPGTVNFAAGVPTATPLGAPVEVLAPGVPSIDAALAASDVTVSAVYTTPHQHHNPMEPHAAVAVWTDDRLTLYTATQGVMNVVSHIARALGVDQSKVHVVNPYVGGAFGGKIGNWAPVPLAAAAARALSRPVKVALTREQTFAVSGHRPPSHQTVTLGAAKDGTLVVVRHDGISGKSQSGPSSENVANHSLTAYAAPNLHVSRAIVPLDVSAMTPMRAPGESHGAFALESAMDELAFKLNMDPLALRRKNYAATVPNTGNPWSSKHLDECYDVGAHAFGWDKRNPVPGAVLDGDWFVGLGMATATYPASRSKSSMKVRLQADGTAVVSGTGADLGTGQFTVFAILGSQALGIPVSSVRAELGDSSLPPATPAGGSTSTSSNGPSLLAAADGAKAALVTEAAQNPQSPFYGKTPVYEGGMVRADGVAMTFGSLLTAMDLPAVEGTSALPGGTTKGYGYLSFGAHFCEVRVNRWTGEPRVARWLTVIDGGTIVNEKTARSQILGAVVMGIGGALLEDSRVEPDTGRYAGANMAAYLVPVNADIPPVDVRFLDHPDTVFSPLGARGIGELGIVGVAGAVANAVHNATGRRVRDLPITLDKLL
ncbi:xanthine dehydrogenase family protein molybdopterin-binding subunit [Kutzneria sp. NPDC051319]|uniref:xanthine dehydrogenase family protein molybdopterin-binding subunit n=1 Tax=Kutzneria sp. NPDC051319 TaxID=3155047 RepID=UPI0034305E64